MARKDEISSTEKLLNLIRGKEPAPSCPITSSSSPPVKKAAIFNALNFQKAVGIGVEIGHIDIKISKINRISDKSFELLDYDTVSVPEFDSFNTPRLAKNLSATLSRFCTGLKRYDIWCCVASAMVETRCIRIPKLPKKQIPNAVFWTFSKEVSFNDQEMLLDFRILGDVIENGITKTQVMTFTIPIAETDALKKLFAMAGYPLTGISIVPFAIQNLLKTDIVQESGEDTCCLFIGRDWSRITIYAKGDLILSRGIKAGMHSMIEAIAEQHRQSSDDRKLSNSSLDEITVASSDDNETDPIYETAKAAFYNFLKPDAPLSPSPEHDDADDSFIFQTIRPAIERLVKQVERTISHFSMNFKQPGVQEILISGKVTARPDIIAHIGSRLGLPINVLNPLPESHPFTRKVMVPAFPVEKESYVPAIGIGLSTNDLTPNFLFTHRQRERRDRARKIRIGISAASIGFLLLLFCCYLWQEHRIESKANQVMLLTQTRNAFNIPLTQNLIMALYSKATQKRALMSTLGRRYHGAAVIAEVSRLTPPTIRLISLSADVGTDTVTTKEKSEPMMVIEGIVTGDKIKFETDLASYLLTMEASPLFERPIVKHKQLQFDDAKQVLRFSIQFKLV